MADFNLIVDRPRREAALAAAAAWVAFLIGLLAGGEIVDAASFGVAVVSGAVFVGVGFAAASRCRTLSRLTTERRVRLGIVSLALGAVLGCANLAANQVIAGFDPALRALLVERVTALEPLQGLIASPFVEEVTVRLFLMSVMAWVVYWFTSHRQLAFAFALVGSALFFAVLHLDRQMPSDPTLANLYRTSLVTKYTLAGLPLGWMFWRWGLPYAILCHVAANAAHLALQRYVF